MEHAAGPCDVGRDVDFYGGAMIFRLGCVGAIQYTALRCDFALGNQGVSDSPLLVLECSIEYANLNASARIEFSEYEKSAVRSCVRFCEK